MVGKATTGSSFGGLARYLTQDPGRVEWTQTRGVFATDPREVAREMRAAAAGHPSRTEKPVYHLTLSFARSDEVTPEQMQEVASRVLGDIGLSEHQALLVAHRDKEHAHVHVMVSRIHPETGQAWQTGHDYRRIEKTLRAVEKEWGLERTPGHHARAPGEPAPDRSQSRTTAEIRIERESGQPPFPDRVCGDVGAAFREAKSWGDLESRLKEHGYRIEAAGRGMVITDGERYAKASSVAPEASRRLEERFGQGLGAHLAAKGEREAAPPLAGGRDAAALYSKMFGSPAIDLSTGQPAQERPLPESLKTPEEKYRELFSQPALRREAVQGRQPGEALARALPSTEHPAKSGAPSLPDAPAPESKGPGAAGGQGAASGRAAGALAAAVRPLSSEDGEREAVFRGLETGLRLGTALAGGQGRPAAQEPASPAGPKLEELAGRIAAYREAEKKQEALSGIIREHAALERELKSAGRQEQHLAAYERGFDRHLARTYTDPAAAKERFLEVARAQGPDTARQQMRRSPEHFGEAREARRAKWMGFATELDKAPAYRAALSAAEHGAQYAQARAALLGPSERRALESAIAAKKSEIGHLQRALAGPGSPSRLLGQIGKELRRLPAPQQEQLSRLLSPGGLRVMRQAAQTVLEAARGRGR